MESISRGRAIVWRTLAGVTPTSAATSSTVADRPFSDSRRTWVRRTLDTRSPSCTGRRMVRPLLAMAREIDCRIHHVA
jgi:hypothetical protein